MQQTKREPLERELFIELLKSADLTDAREHGPSAKAKLIADAIPYIVEVGFNGGFWSADDIKRSVSLQRLEERRAAEAAEAERLAAEAEAEAKRELALKRERLKMELEALN